MRQRTTDFVRAQVRRAAGEVVVHAGQPDAGVDGRRAGTKLKVEIRRFVERPRIGTGRRDFHEHVVVDQDAVLVLTGRLAVFLQGLEPPSLPRLRFELDLLLRTAAFPARPGKLARIANGGVLHSKENSAPSFGRNPL